MILRNCNHIFHGTHNGVLQQCFFEQARNGLEKYKQIMEHKFLVELDNSSQYTKLWNFEVFSKWFECKILNVTTNLFQWFDVLYPHPHTSNFQWIEELSSTHFHLETWYFQKLKNLSCTHLKLERWIPQQLEDLSSTHFLKL
jgi:hypothetical protein